MHKRQIEFTISADNSTPHILASHETANTKNDYHNADRMNVSVINDKFLETHELEVFVHDSCLWLIVICDTLINRFILILQLFHLTRSQALFEGRYL